MAKFEIKYFIIGIIIANQKVDRSSPPPAPLIRLQISVQTGEGDSGLSLYCDSPESPSPVCITKNFINITLLS